MSRRLAIVDRAKPYPVSVACAGDFRCRDGGAVDPEVVIREPAISLYCLDHDNGQALFVETLPEVDLTAAPFYYQAQYENATSLIAVPYGVLHELAAQVPFDPGRVALIYSTGRCGSTLVVQALAELGGVIGLSEPDALTQLVTIPDSGQLAQSCLRLLCAQAHGRVIAIKPRSFALELATSLHQAFPETRPIFLYRDPLPWARSTARAFAAYDPALRTDPATVQDRLARLIPLVAKRYHGVRRVLTPAEVMACQWVSQMERALALRHTGADLFTASYEELTADPPAVMTALFAHCGLPAPTDLQGFLAKDSQEATSLSRPATRERNGDFDEAELVRVIAELWAQVLR